MCLTTIENILKYQDYRRPFEIVGKTCGNGLGDGAVCVHVVTVLHSKFNAGSRCDKGQENNKVPLLV